MSTEKEGTKKKKRGARRFIRIGLIIVMLGVFAYSSINLFTYYYASNKAQAAAADLKDLLNEEEDKRPVITLPVDDEDGPVPTPEPVYEVQERFKPLLELNEDVIGWIKVPGTNIDYPVLQTPDDPEFYLNHNFEGGFDNLGMPFLDGRCEVGPNSNHFIVYAHNIKSKIMFHNLTYYEDEEFWEGHKYVYFDTIYEKINYEVVAAYIFDVGASKGLGFQFHRYVDFDEEQFDDFMENVREKALYDTGVEVEYGDELLTMATCEYSTWNSRFVLLARRIS